MNIQSPTCATKEEAKENLRRVLKKYHLDTKMSADTIISWIQRPDAKKQMYLRIALCIMDEEAKMQERMEFANAVIECGNHWMITENGLTPMERGAKNLENFGKRGVDIRIFDFSCPEAYAHHDMGMLAMQVANGKKAVQEFQKMFSVFLTEGMTVPEPYRLYGNLCMAYLQCGDRDLAEDALKKALAFNPKYDFALRVKERIEAGDFDMYLEEKHSKKSKAPLPSEKFYRFITSFGINFETLHLTKTPIHRY